MNSEWPVVRLGDYCLKIGSGATPRGGKSVYLDAGETTLIRSQNIYNDGFTADGLVYITKSAADKLNNVEVLAGDILLNITGDSVARVCIAPTEYLPARVNQHVSIIRPNPEDFDARFLRYFLVSPEQQELLLIIASAGATRNALTKGHIESLEISKPSLAIQTRIANQLETLDKKIEINQQINQTLEQMAQAIFKSWFVDFEPVKAKMAALEAGSSEDDALLAAMQVISGKDPQQLTQLQTENPEHYTTLRATAELFPAAMQESELGEIPEGWEVLPLSKMVELIGGGTPKRSEPTYWGGDICWFSVRDAPSDGNVLVIDTDEKITEAGLKGSSTRLLPLGTTIITARGTVGKLALTGVITAMNQSCYGVVGVEGTGPYLNYLQVHQAVETLQRNTHGAVFDTITRTTFETVFQTQASVELRDDFEKLVTPVFETIKNNLQQNKALSELRDSLLPKLLSGELSVNKDVD